MTSKDALAYHDHFHTATGKDEQAAVETVTMLLDGDTVAFTAASACNHTIEDEQGFIMPFANIMEGEACVDNIIGGLMRDLGAHYVQVYLSDPESNWRKEIYPDYKANRRVTVRPLLLGRLKEYLRVQYGASHWAGLEADDVLGILATSPEPYPGMRLIVGKDKDFRTIPGMHHQIGNRVSGKCVIEEITQEHADWFHLVQTLAGDRIDGYPGCPGIGMERARKILDDPQILVPERGVVTRGPRKGQDTAKWVSSPANGNLWASVVSHYEKAGQGEKEALLTARLANILRYDQYDKDTGEITLWTPPKHLSMPTGERHG